MIKLFRTIKGVVLQSEDGFYAVDETDWNQFVNDDEILEKMRVGLRNNTFVPTTLQNEEILPPIDKQELWACGVTYLRSKEGRQEESQSSGGGDFYAKVYEAERPEVFFKSTSHRVVGHGGNLRIRKDSNWNVPEPELTLMVTSSGKIIGYTIGNDMSSRSIEGENPLYLPQAKTYDGCAALGPCILLTEKFPSVDDLINLVIKRNGGIAFQGSVRISQMKRSFEELASWVFRECSFPYGCLIMTGTGIVPPNDFTLHPGDEIDIEIPGIGILSNRVA